VKQFILYDARAQGGDTDEAVALDTATSEREARRISRQHVGEGAVWYEYDVEGKERKSAVRSVTYIEFCQQQNAPLLAGKLEVSVYE
jgi:hypothetical protein